uniref:Uncharacterized protein n=1 Tax=Ectopseudomonas mendocina (strain ymp) TaxID=399739 RepID=A4XWX0_ECTM1
MPIFWGARTQLTIHWFKTSCKRSKLRINRLHYYSSRNINYHDRVILSKYKKEIFAALIISVYFLCLAIYKSTAVHYSVSAAIIFIITAPLLLSYVEMKLFKNA